MRFCLRATLAVLLFSVNLSLSVADESDVLSIMQARDEAQCRQLGPAFLRSLDGFEDALVKELAAACYTAKARLYLFGVAQPAITNGSRVQELPTRVIAEETGMSLDPYAPLAGKRLRE